MNWPKYSIEALEASKTLRPITKEQRMYGENHCEKIAVSFSNKLYCSECGSYVGKKADFKIDMRCNCGAKLHQVLKKGRYGYYYDIITTHKNFQVVRHFIINKYVKDAEKAKYTCDEVVQNWIDENGCESTIARRLKSFSYDRFIFSSEMALKRKNEKYDIEGYIQFPCQKFTEQLRKYGAKKAIGIPNIFCSELIKNRQFESFLKMGQEKVVRAITYGQDVKDLYNEIRICTKHGYKIEDCKMWRDYLSELKELGYDTRNPKYICPTDLREAHEVTNAKIRKKWDKEAKEREKIELEERLKRLKNAEKTYGKFIAKFIGICIIGEGITIKPLASIKEFKEEGDTMHHCVFSNEYYNDKNALIMSARDEDGNRIETIEINLTTMQIEQSRGKFNQNTERHDEIINLVNRNMNMIKKCKRLKIA